VYEHVIVPFDGTEPAQRAATVAAELAQRFDAELVLATASDLDTDEIERLKAAAQDRSDAKVTAWVEQGSSQVDAIAEVVGHRPNSLLCMYSSGRTGIRRVVYGSLAERLLHHLDVPVVVLGPQAEQDTIRDHHSLLVCVDSSATSDAAVALAEQWGRQLALSATVAHIRGHDDDPELDLEPVLTRLRAACPVVEAVQPSASDPAGALVDLAQHTTGALVVIGTHARSRAQRLLHTSVAAELIHGSPQPLLVQRGPALEVASG
jgi:nucleotide-binding universal stress UspA family protein